MHSVLRPRLIALGLALAVTLPTTPADAAPVSDAVSVDAHMRTRFIRHDGRDGDRSGDPYEVIENRVRLGVRLSTDAGWGGFVQLQDVRVWGEEANTLGDFSADGLDLHQAYADLPIVKDVLTARIGRQEMIFDEQRLIGAVGWAPQGRSFDAARLTWTPSTLPLSVDAFYAQLSDQDTIEPAPGGTPTNTNAGSAGLAGLVTGVDLLEGSRASNHLSLTLLFERAPGPDRTRVTASLHDRGHVGVFRYRAEAAWQGGDANGATISAFMVGLRAGVLLESAGHLGIDLWADWLSGASDPTKSAVETFDVPYATNHAFYGFADFFLNLPVHTEGQGLIDLAVKASVKPCPKLKLLLHAHRFLVAEDRGGPSDLGWELDLAATWAPAKPVKLTFQMFLMLPGDALVAQARVVGDDPHLALVGGVQVDL